MALLGAGILFKAGAIVLTPDELSIWIAESYFGTDGGILYRGQRDDKFKREIGLLNLKLLRT